MVLTTRFVCGITDTSNFVVVSQTHPTELVATLEASHMITALILFNVVDAIRSWAFLGDFVDRGTARFLLNLLIQFLATRGTIVVLFACLSAVPGILVDNAGFVSASMAGEYVALLAA